MTTQQQSQENSNPDDDIAEIFVSPSRTSGSASIASTALSTSPADNGDPTQPDELAGHAHNDVEQSVSDGRISC